MAYGGFVNGRVRTRFSLSMEMSRLTRDGTDEPVSRDQILRHARGQGNIIFPVQLHRMTRMTGPDCAVMCNLINIHTSTSRAIV